MSDEPYLPAEAWDRCVDNVRKATAAFDRLFAALSLPDPQTTSDALWEAHLLVWRLDAPPP